MPPSYGEWGQRLRGCVDAGTVVYFTQPSTSRIVAARRSEPADVDGACRRYASATPGEHARSLADAGEDALVQAHRSTSEAEGGPS